MKALMAIDDAMKAALVKIHGVAEEDELPDSIQDIEFDRDGSLSEEYDTVEKLQKVFATAMPKADKAALLKVAESTIKQLGELYAARLSRKDSNTYYASQTTAPSSTTARMRSRAATGSSAGYQQPGATPPRRSSMPKAAVAWPTQSSRSPWATRSVTAAPSAALASTRIALTPPTSASTVRMIGMLNSARFCIAPRSASRDRGSSFMAPKRSFQNLRTAEINQRRET